MDFASFLGPSYVSQSPNADVEECINWYYERLESTGATARGALYPTPGVRVITTAGAGPGRAHFFMNSKEFAVIGTTFYEIFESGAIAARGTVATDSNPATISSNGDGGGELFITSGGNGYIYTLVSHVLTQVAALDGKATQGGHLDGYFLALDAATSTLYISNLLDGLTWTTGTDFAQRSSAPDPWVAMLVFGSFIRLFGELTSDVWYNAGAANFPFAPQQSGFIPYGIAAPFSAAIAGRDMIWLSTAKEGGALVLRASGFAPEVISSYPFQTAVGRYDVVSDATADTYSENGHTFYVLHFTSEDVTWCWDRETRQWHKRGTWVVAESAYIALRVRWHAYAFGEHRMLDSITGSIYRQSTEISTDVDGAGIRRLRRAPALVTQNERVYYASFELDLEPGLGLVTGQGENPQVMIRMSNDGGKTWGTEHMRSAGKLGEYFRRVRMNRCGSGRRRVFEVSVSDPVPWRIVGAFLELGQQPEGLDQQRPQRGAA